MSPLAHIPATTSVHINQAFLAITLSKKARTQYHLTGQDSLQIGSQTTADKSSSPVIRNSLGKEVCVKLQVDTFLCESLYQSHALGASDDLHSHQAKPFVRASVLAVCVVTVFFNSSASVNRNANEKRCQVRKEPEATKLSLTGRVLPTMTNEDVRRRGIEPRPHPWEG